MIASPSGFSIPGLLNSATTRGMPFTNNTASGITCPRPLVSSTLNWLMTRKSLFCQLSKSMTRTACGRPWSQSGLPSAIVPCSSNRVAAWLASMSRYSPSRSNSRVARSIRASSSQGCPSGPGLIRRSAARSRSLSSTSRKLARSVSSGTSVSPSSHPQPIALSCSQKGRSTRSYSH